MILGPDGKPIRRPEKSEIITADKLNWQIIMNMLPDPDIILQKTGKTAEVFEEMENDPHVWACLSSRKAGVLTKEWDVLPAGDSPREQEIASFVKSALDDLDMDSLIRQVLDAPFHGYTVHELIWKEARGRWVIDTFKDRPQKYFGFDVNSNLLFKGIFNLDGELMPGAKFLVARHEGSEKKPYGVRLASKCYWPWLFKKHGYKFWAIFVEKYGMPLAIGKYSPGSSEQDKADLVQALIDLVQDAAVAIPSNSEVDFKSAGEGKERIHQMFMEFCESSISKAILGQTLTTQIGETGGAYAAAKVHSGVRDDINESDAKLVMSAINDQPVWWLVDFNYGPQERYPSFVIHYEEEQVQKDRAERDRALVEMGLRIPARYFYTRYNIPEPQDDEPVVAPPALTAGGQPGAPGPQFSMAPRRPSSPAPGRREPWVDFTADGKSTALARDEMLEKYFRRCVDEGVPYYQAVADDLKRQIRAAGSYEEAGRIRPDREELARLAEYHIRVNLTGYMLGEWATWQDYLGARTQEEAQFDDLAGAFNIDAVSLSLEDAVSFFSRLMPVDIENYRKLERQLRDKYFTISAIEGDDMVARVKEEIEKSLEDGTTFENFKKGVNELFAKMGLDQADPWHLENVFRTNIQTAYSAGQYEKLQDPAVADMFPYYRYSAVRDTRTRPAHVAMHGFVAARDDPIWNEWWPPNGYSCRCGVIAINKYKARRENIVPTSERPPFEPDKGFARNPGEAFREVPPDMLARR
ncbi:phage portal protein family protein [Pelotomaculum propionicicum]|uniref:Phage head morphogenesis domain-containing protein n=1 Tax=Pelotomaculum propionicicum TaxID=258475 RepID=A0A4Y7RK18_9FIRM|nr:DUF935 family protein [Pelotomaculum propionicicum]TEB09151.1 hypothetical protein Pmgp_03372 [Pelotomaculum propionicicum]